MDQIIISNNDALQIKSMSDSMMNSGEYPNVMTSESTFFLLSFVQFLSKKIWITSCESQTDEHDISETHEEGDDSAFLKSKHI